MFDRRSLPVALGLGLFATFAATPARSQTFRRETSTLHVVDPLRVPGAVLAPGSYEIRVVDEQSDRNVVEVTDLDGRRVYATMIATPHEAARPRANAEFVFDEDAEGRPAALRSWWPPNDRYGQDFVYDGAERAEIARLAERVPRASAAPPAVFASSAPAAAPPAAVPAVNRPRPAAVVAEARPAAKKKLPKTASPLPLVALLGTAFLCTGAALRAAGRP